MQYYNSFKRVTRSIEVEFHSGINKKRFYGAYLLTSSMVDDINAKITSSVGPEYIIDKSRILSPSWIDYYNELKEDYLAEIKEVSIAELEGRQSIEPKRSKAFSILNKHLTKRMDKSIEFVKVKLRKYLSDPKNANLVDNIEKAIEQEVEGIKNEFTMYGVELVVSEIILSLIGTAVEEFTEETNAENKSKNQVKPERHYYNLLNLICNKILEGDSVMNCVEHHKSKFLMNSGYQTSSVNEHLKSYGAKDQLFYDELTYRSLELSQPPLDRKYRDLSDPQVQAEAKSFQSFDNPVRVYDGKKVEGYGEAPTDKEARELRANDLLGNQPALRLTKTKDGFTTAIQLFATYDLRNKLVIRNNIEVGNSNDAECIYNGFKLNNACRLKFNKLNQLMPRAELHIFDRMMNNQYILHDITRMKDYFIAAAKSNGKAHKKMMREINRVLAVVDECMKSMSISLDQLIDPNLLATLIQKGIDETKSSLKLENFRFYGNLITYSNVAEFEYIQGKNSIFPYNPNNPSKVKAPRKDIYLTSFNRIKNSEDASNKLVKFISETDGKSCIIPELRSVLARSTINEDIYDRIKNLKIDLEKLKNRSIKNAFTVISTNLINMDPLTVIKLYGMRNDIEVAFYDETTYYGLELNYTHNLDPIRGRALVNSLTWNTMQIVRQKAIDAGVKITVNEGRITHKSLRSLLKTLFLIVDRDTIKLDMFESHRAIVDALVPLKIDEYGCVPRTDVMDYLSWKPSAKWLIKHPPKPKKIEKPKLIKETMKKLQSLKKQNFNDLLKVGSKKVEG